MKSVTSLVWILCCIPSAWADGPHTIEVFTDAHFPVTGLDEIRSRTAATVTIYDLGAPDHLEKRLGVGLPADRDAARQTVLHRLQTLPEWQARFRAAYQGYALALNRQITKLPAVVFDGEAVIYGVTDLSKAWALYGRRKAGP